MGGQSIPMLDYYLAPYVAKSFVRNFAKYLEIKYFIDPKELKEKLIKPIDRWIFDHANRIEARIMNKTGESKLLDIVLDDFNQYKIDIEEFYKARIYAEKQTDKDTYQAMEALIHNLCTLNSRSGGQVPFSSVNLGTDTTPEGRMVIKNLLLATNDGLGHGETAIFPISIMKMKKGITDKGSPNYDLFQLACKVSAKRLFPNFLNLDAPYNLKYYKENKPETQVASMGMIDSGIVNIKYTYNDTTIQKSVDISELGHFLVDNSLGKYTSEYNKPFLSLVKVTSDVKIFDIYKNDWIKLNLWLRDADPKLEWYKLVTDKGFDHILSHDHPLVVDNCGVWDRIFVKDIKIGDIIYGRDKSHHVVTEILKLECEQRIGYDVNTESDMFGIDNIASHNCRTRVIGNIHNPEKEITPGKGNIFMTTINLPYVALRAKRRIDNNEDTRSLIEVFFDLLEEQMDEVFDMMLDRFEIIAKRKAKNYPFSMCQHVYMDSETLNADDEIREVIKNGTLTTGFIGLAETLIVLTGKHHGESEESQKLGLEIIGYMNNTCIEKSKETKLNFSLMGSPAEGCCGRLLRLTRKEFGVVEGVTDHEYHVNSHHIPPYFSISAKKKIDIEAPYHALEPAGHISYIEVEGDPSKNVEAFQSLVEYMAEKNMGYFSINHPVDRDPICGYVGIIDDVCPRCGRKDGEGVEVGKLLSLQTYQPDPGYAIRASMVEEIEETLTNPIED